MKDHPFFRQVTFDTIDRQVYDVAIIGGGINGAGIARECALRGLKVVLIDQDDFGAGTSSVSSKLVHGGLRYLKHFDFRLVYEALRERHYLLQNAPHLVQRLQFMIPIYESGPYSSWFLRMGLWIYDLLAHFRKEEPHRFVSAEELVQMEPKLNSDGLKSGLVFSDAQMDDARICLENILQAHQLGADVFNYVKLVRLVRVGKRIEHLVVRHMHTQEERVVTAKYVVNTTGPWTDEVLSNWDSTRKSLLRLSKGIHVVVRIPWQKRAMLVLAREDKRVFFVLPWHGNTLIGTTDTAYSGTMDQLKPTEADIDYLLQNAQPYFKDHRLSRADVLTTFVGCRPLVRQSNRALGGLSRKHRVIKQYSNVLVVVGGKYTTYRSLSEGVARRVMSFFGRGWFFRSLTRHLPLYGGEIKDLDRYVTKKYPVESNIYPIDKMLYRHVVFQYGSVYADALSVMCENEVYRDRLKGTGYYRGDVIYAIRHECAVTIVDFMRRRTRLFFERDHGLVCLDDVGTLFQQELEWSDDRCEIEKDRYRQFVKDATL